MRYPTLAILLWFLTCCSPSSSDNPANIESLNTSMLSQNGSLVNTSKSPFVKLEALGIYEVRLTEGFWADRQRTAIETMIPEMWRIYSDPEIGHAVRNFEIAAGVKEGKHGGAPFHDGDFYKLMEAVCMAYAITGDEMLNQMLDEVIPLIKASQRAVGYIHTPVMIKARNEPETTREFQDRMDFESYNMGHLMTAATLHYKATGKTELMEVAKKAADYLYTYCQKFPEKMAMNAICPSHYMGVIELYRTTNDPKYLELAKQFIDIRSMMKEGTDHNQDRIPFREQTQAVGHAVRANYLYAGVADTYSESGDESLKIALDHIWDDLTQTKLYVTGGCGALYDGVSPNGTTYKQSTIQQVHQAYGQAYQLPNAAAHNETCANIGSVLWNWRMHQITAEAKYADLLELTLFNSVLSGANLNGKGYFYTNPLSNQKDLPYQLRWPNVRQEYISYSNCCPPNTIRTITEVSNYLYSKNEDGIWLNMYAGSEVNTTLGKDQLSLVQSTDYPWDGTINIEIKTAPQQAKSINLRIPDWCKSASLYHNNKKIQATEASGTYLSVNQSWKTGDKIRLVLAMPVQLIEANPSIEETRNQVAIKRGPIVYCVEGIDLKEGQKVSTVVIPSNIKFEKETFTIGKSELMSLKGIAKMDDDEWKGGLYNELSLHSSNAEIRLIPYFAWANRDESDMTVWLPLDR